jgi:hypothetical protein
MSSPEEKIETLVERLAREEKEALALEMEQSRRDYWNSKYLPGVRVCAILGNGKASATTTRSEANLKEGKAVVYVVGTHEPVSVDQVTALEDNPKAIVKILHLLRAEYRPEETKAIREGTEDHFVDANLSTIGMRVYRAWVHDADDTTVLHWFFKEKIYNPVAISAILLRAFHRYITIKPVDLPGLIEKYKKIQSKAEE